MKAHENPFAPDRVQRLLPFDPELSGTTWSAIERQWQHLNQRAAVVGLHGSGKTTFLKAFAKRHQASHRVETLFFHRDENTLSEEQRALVRSLALAQQENTLLLVDGEGHLKIHERRWLRSQSRRIDGYLVARHHGCRLPTLLKLKSSPQLAQQLLARIHPASARQKSAILPSLLRRANGNLRELWLNCYDDSAGLSDKEER